MKAHMINPPAALGVDMVREGRCMQRAGAWTAIWSPISLATIAAVLEREGIECRLDDCIIEGLGKEDTLKRAKDFEPDLFVINTSTPSIEHDIKLAADLKRLFPRAKTLAIGIHVTALPEESMALCPDLDAIVAGEPELTVRDAALAIRDNSPLEGIPGLIVSGKDGLIRGPEREKANLDELPIPAWGLIKRELYTMPFSGNPFLLIGTSRGCPHRCEFCADPVYYGHALRVKSPERIVDELRYIKDEYGIREFLFWSESFTLKRSWTKEVLERIIEANLGLAFVVNSRTDHVDLELLKLMKKAGCWMIGYGLESGSQEILDRMNKKTTLEQNANAVRWTKEAGLQATAHTVLGYPGETAETIKKTIDFVCSLPLDFAQFYCAVPFPGSKLYQEAIEKGWIVDARWEMFEQNFAIISTPELPAEEIAKWRSVAYRRFYSDPGRVWRVLKNQVGIRGLPKFARMALDFKGWI